MKNPYFLIISVLVLGWMSGCSSIQNSELRDRSASPTPQTDAVPTPSLTTLPQDNASPNRQPNAAPAPLLKASPQDATPQANSSESEDAVAVIQRYYNAIDRRDYQQAYRTWQDNGSASHQTFETFKNGFAETSSTQVKIGKPSEVEGAAGSQYVTVPVTLTATTQNRAVQHFKGTYVLRRSLVDETSADRRSWHIYSAKLVLTE